MADQETTYQFLVDGKFLVDFFKNKVQANPESFVPICQFFENLTSECKAVYDAHQAVKSAYLKAKEAAEKEAKDAKDKEEREKQENDDAEIARLLQEELDNENAPFAWKPKAAVPAVVAEPIVVPAVVAEPVVPEVVNVIENFVVAAAPAPVAEPVAVNTVYAQPAKYYSEETTDYVQEMLDALMTFQPAKALEVVATVPTQVKEQAWQLVADKFVTDFVDAAALLQQTPEPVLTKAKALVSDKKVSDLTKAIPLVTQFDDELLNSAYALVSEKLVDDLTKAAELTSMATPQALKQAKNLLSKKLVGDFETAVAIAVAQYADA